MANVGSARSARTTVAATVAGARAATNSPEFLQAIGDEHRKRDEEKVAGAPSDVDVLMVANVDEEVKDERHEDDCADPEKRRRPPSQDDQHPAHGAKNQHRSETEQQRDPHMAYRHRVDEHANERRAREIHVSKGVARPSLREPAEWPPLRHQARAHPSDARRSSRIAAVTATMSVNMIAAKVLKRSVAPSRQPQKARSRGVSLPRHWNSTIRRRQAERVSCRVMRLIPQQPLQAVNRAGSGKTSASPRRCSGPSRSTRTRPSATGRRAARSPRNS